MSAVTKIFIVLLVVCSLLLVAANVVFVNRVEDYRKIATEKETRVKQAEAARDLANATAASKESWEKAVTMMYEDKLMALRSENAALGKSIEAKGSELANALKQAEAFKTQFNTATGIADAVAKQNVVMEGQLKDLRTELAQLITRKTDIEIELTRNIKEVLNLREQLKEQLERNAELTEQINRQEKIVSAGGTADVKASDVPFAGNINGVISKVQPWRDMVIATVNVGSVDRVTQGMKFHVVDKGNYLGTLVIIGNPDPNEAFGRIEGPKAKDVKEGMQVRTQLNAS